MSSGDGEIIEEVQVQVSAAFVSGLGPSMQTLNGIVHEIARTDIPVLLIGETGSGKDAYARLIHRLSAKSHLRFRKFSCAAFDTGLLLRQVRRSSESEPQTGPCGTMYLDNLQELDSAAQRALLSCFTDGEDSDSGLEQSVRCLSSATSSLESDVELSRFRRELYFRLNGVCLRIPPLRERPDDLPLLTEHFLSKHSIALKKNAPQLNERVIRALSLYHWPGNIRELENFTRKVVIFGDFQIALDELQSASALISKSVFVGQDSSLKMVARAASKKAERELILQALERTHWNRKRAARDLRISYKSLLCKIKQINVSHREQEN